MLAARVSQSLAQTPSRRRTVNVQAQSAQNPAAQPAAPKPLIANRRQLVLGGVAAAALCTCCPPGPALASDWGYTCPNGPDAWEGTCKTSLSQSPIDIPISTLETIRFNYPDVVRGTVINNGHGSPQVNIAEDTICQVQLEGETYQLVQFHFHAPSEHTFNGKHTLMEAHLVHKNIKTGELAVLGVMLQSGAKEANSALAAALTGPPTTGVSLPLASISPKSLLPSARSADGRRPYVSYPGSLTTPPCTEGVSWVVFLDPLEVAASQILGFLTFGGKDGGLTMNARPVQPVNDRKLRYFV